VTHSATSLIIPSGECNAEWLARILPRLLFTVPPLGGQHPEAAVLFDPSTHDVRPVRLDARGQVEPWQIN